MKLTLIAAALGAAALCAGCATHGGASHLVTGKVRAAIKADQVTLYLEAPKKYEVIGLVSASAYGDVQKHRDKAVEDLKAQAAQMGANGIILQPTSYGDAASSPSLQGHAVTFNGTAVFVEAQ